MSLPLCGCSSQQWSGVKYRGEQGLDGSSWLESLALAPGQKRAGARERLNSLCSTRDTAAQPICKLQLGQVANLQLWKCGCSLLNSWIKRQFELVDDRTMVKKESFGGWWCSMLPPMPQSATREIFRLSPAGYTSIAHPILHVKVQCRKKQRLLYNWNRYV